MCVCVCVCVQWSRAVRAALLSLASFVAVIPAMSVGAALATKLLF